MKRAEGDRTPFARPRKPLRQRIAGRAQRAKRASESAMCNKRVENRKCSLFIGSNYFIVAPRRLALVTSGAPFTFSCRRFYCRKVLILK